jgi:hypothetical protein
MKFDVVLEESDLEFLEAGKRMTIPFQFGTIELSVTRKGRIPFPDLEPNCEHERETCDVSDLNGGFGFYKFCGECCEEYKIVERYE